MSGSRPSLAARSVAGDVGRTTRKPRHAARLAPQHPGPQLVGVGSEHVVLRGHGGDDPRALGELGLELALRPAGIAAEHPQLLERHLARVPAEVHGTDPDVDIERVESTVLGPGRGRAEPDRGVPGDRTADEQDPSEVPLEELRVFCGYAGWSEGQLESELAEGSWVVAAVTPQDDVFGADPDELWARVLRRQPGRVAWLAGCPADVSSN